MGASTTHKTRGDGGKKKTASSSRNRLQGKIDSALSVQRSHVIQKHFRHACLDGALRPPSGQKVHSVVERASWLATPSNFAFDQIAGGIYCAAIGMDEKPTGETWAFTFRGEEELLPRQFRLGSKRSRADDSSSESDNSASEDEAPAGEEEEQALVPAAPTPSRKSSKSSRSNNKKSRQAPPLPPPPPAPKKKRRRNEPSRRRHRQEQDAEDGGDGDTTETEASHLARTRQHKEGDQVLVPSTLGSSQAGSSSSPHRTAEDRPRSSGSDGEPSLGRGKRITSGPYGRAQKRKTSSSPPRSDKVPRPKQRDTVLADPLNAYNHEFETPAFQGRKGDRRAESVTGESEVARLCARVDHLGVRSANGGSAPSSVIDADTVRGSPAPTVDMDEPAAASSSSSAAMTRSASKGKGRAL
ncbi:hypothetical protein RHOSPDRAFT_34173 [Rhodotorula sp. JG-1b]|nr:hypothetical protein RHOSPDRAFT_34173 [Rhodotorula sp. JG-1b]